MSALRRRILGLGALLLILGIIVGLPVVLFAVGANPLDAGLPSWDDVTRALTSPDDGTLAVGLIKVIAWLAWAFLTVSLLVEMFSRLRGIRAPRMPGLRLPQTAARGLVGAAVLLFVALPAAPSAQAASAPDQVTVGIEQAIEQQAAEQAAEQAAAQAELVRHEAQAAAEKAEADSAPTTVTHTVERGDSLWSIAESQLGDGHRFGEIVELNADLLGGEASFLQVGWELTIPAPDAEGAGDQVHTETKDVTVVKGDSLSQIAQDELGDASRYPEIFEASTSIEQPGGVHLTDPDMIDVGWTVQVPGVVVADTPEPEPEPAQAAPPVEQSAPAADVDLASGGADVAAQSGAVGAPGLTGAVGGTGGADTTSESSAQAEVASEDGDRVVRSAEGIGAVLAAGILTLVVARRRTLQRLRRPGQRLPAPEAELADAESALRTTADPLTVETVDVALRSLAHACSTTRTPLPSVRAGRLTAAGFDLYLAEPASLPEPWVAGADRTVWRIDAARAAELRVDRATAPAPYPALVTIGHDDDGGHLFLNLEHLGGLAVAGEDRQTREVVAAMVLELALSTWADDLQVTVVGAFDELEAGLQTGRIRTARSVERVVDDLADRVERDRRAFAAADAADVGQARVTGVAPDAWTPEIVVIAGPITDQQREQLAALATSLPRVAVAAVTTGGPTTPWVLDLGQGSSPEHAVLAPIGLEVRAQRLPSERYGHLLRVMESTDRAGMSGRAVREPSLAEVETIAPVDEPDELDTFGADDDPDATHIAGSRPAAHDLDEATRLRPRTSGVVQIGLRAPRITVLGPVDLQDAGGTVAPTERSRLLEYATYLAVHPGATAETVQAAVWPGRTAVNHELPRTAVSKLRRWLGMAPDGSEFLPRHQSGPGYVLHPAVSADVVDWDELISHQPAEATSQHLEAALALVGGMPFAGAHERRYAWADPLRQRLIVEIVDTSFELARRRILEGRWRAAERAVAVGLSVEPAQESLWRLRLLAAHQSRDQHTESEAVRELLTVTERLAGELEPETSQLLAALHHPRGEFDRLMANAL